MFICCQPRYQACKKINESYETLGNKSLLSTLIPGLYKKTKINESYETLGNESSYTIKLGSTGTYL